MKLTVRDDPERIRRFAHIRPSPLWSSDRCSTPCPGTELVCTRRRGHRGPHVAHGRLGRVVAVWDGARPRGPAVASRWAVPARPRRGKSAGVPRAVGERIVGAVSSAEDAFLLVLFLLMVGFVVDWAVRIVLGG